MDAGNEKTLADFFNMTYKEVEQRRQDVKNYKRRQAATREQRERWNAKRRKTPKPTKPRQNKCEFAAATHLRGGAQAS